MVSFFKKLFGGAQDTATSTASHAIGTSTTSGLTDSLTGMMPGGVPDVAQLQDAVGKLSQGDLATAATESLLSLPTGQRSQFGGLFSSHLGATGAQVSPEVASGNPSDLGGALAGVLKGGGGASALTGLLGGGGTGAAVPPPVVEALTSVR